jgi:hypothetical protein
VGNNTHTTFISILLWQCNRKEAIEVMPHIFSISLVFHMIRQGAEKALYLPAGRQGGYLFEYLNSDGKSL